MDSIFCLRRKFRHFIGANCAFVTRMILNNLIISFSPLSDCSLPLHPSRKSPRIVSHPSFYGLLDPNALHEQKEKETRTFLCMHYDELHRLP